MQDVILQKQAIPDEIEKLRNADDAALAAPGEDSIHRRQDCAYRLLLAQKIGLEWERYFDHPNLRSGDPLRPHVSYTREKGTT